MELIHILCPYQSSLDLSSVCFDGSESAAVAECVRKTGFAVVMGAVNTRLVKDFTEFCIALDDEVARLDPARVGNRGSHRYSKGAISVTGQHWHHHCFSELALDPAVTAVLDAIHCPYYMAAGGDFCLGECTDFQCLHSDLNGQKWQSKEEIPVVSVSLTLEDWGPLNGAMRIVDRDAMQTWGEDPPSLQDELQFRPQWLASRLYIPAGALIFRDIRVWHGGVPNGSGKTRYMPSITAGTWKAAKSRAKMNTLPAQLLNDHPAEHWRFHHISGACRVPVGIMQLSTRFLQTQTCEQFCSPDSALEWMILLGCAQAVPSAAFGTSNWGRVTDKASPFKGAVVKVHDLVCEGDNVMLSCTDLFNGHCFKIEANMVEKLC